MTTQDLADLYAHAIIASAKALKQDPERVLAANGGWSRRPLLPAIWGIAHAMERVPLEVASVFGVRASTLDRGYHQQHLYEGVVAVAAAVYGHLYTIRKREI